MAGLARLARSGMIIGLASMLTGLAVSLLGAAAEAIDRPGLSLEDGYWIGRLPWSELGVWLAVCGATAAVAFGAAAVWIIGGGLRRVAVAVPVAMTASWWWYATHPALLGPLCPSCPPRGSEPFVMAYSDPGSVLMLLVLPAVLVSILEGRLPDRADQTKSLNRPPESGRRTSKWRWSRDRI